MLFTGSDWCPPCQSLETNVLASPHFVQFAEQNLVLLKLDYPRYKKQSSKLTRQNERLAKQYKQKGYPTIVVLNSQGEEMDRLTGAYASAEELVYWLTWVMPSERRLKDYEQWKEKNASLHWHFDFDEAKQSARLQKHPILAFFLGPDWSQASRQIETILLESDEFKKLAAKNFCLLLSESLSDAYRPLQQLRQYRETARQFDLNPSSYPIILLLDMNGKALASKQGSVESVQEFKQWLKNNGMAIKE